MIFQSNDGYTLELLNKEKILFAKSWDRKENFPYYKKSALPGKTKGINASCVDGYFFGICKYIMEEKKIAAIKVLKF